MKDSISVNAAPKPRIRVFDRNDPRLTEKQRALWDDPLIGEHLRSGVMCINITDNEGVNDNE